MIINFIIVCLDGAIKPTKQKADRYEIYDGIISYCSDKKSLLKTEGREALQIDYSLELG